MEAETECKAIGNRHGTRRYGCGEEQVQEMVK